jgi:hypothetical protein
LRSVGSVVAARKAAQPAAPAGAASPYGNVQHRTAPGTLLTRSAQSSSAYLKQGSDFKKKTLLTSALAYSGLGFIMAIYNGVTGSMPADAVLPLAMLYVLGGLALGMTGTALYNSMFSSKYNNGEFTMSVISPMFLGMLLITGIGIILLLIILAALKK